MTLPPIKIGLIALMGVAAVGMGYTTLFPDVESEYAGMPAGQTEQGNHTEPGSDVPTSTSLATLSAEAPMSLEPAVEAVSEGLDQPMAKLTIEPESVAPLPPLLAPLQREGARRSPQVLPANLSKAPHSKADQKTSGNNGEPKLWREWLEDLCQCI